MSPAEAPAVADLIFHSTNAWYQRRGLGPIFAGSPADCLVFPELYEALDPGCGLVAEHEETGELAGSCFFHPRPTHVSLGIMNAHPDHAGSGVAKLLLRDIIRIADGLGRPLRLVSSAFNLDSFSLYTRHGFAPYAVFQDMTLPVPPSGLAVPPVDGVRFREAVPADVPAIAALEHAVWDTERAGDWRHFTDNRSGLWHVTVAERLDDGRLCGALASVVHPGSRMLGPGVMTDARITLSLILAELNARRDVTPVFLVPSAERELVARLYALGARNCELHFGQCRGPAPTLRGVVMPTFLPETA
jgi:GNAT superfamily N-acetyltransferase